MMQHSTCSPPSGVPHRHLACSKTACTCTPVAMAMHHRMALQKTDAADLLISGPHRSHNADTLTSQAGSAELYRHAEDRTASPAANSGCAPRAGLAAVAGALRVCSSLLHPAQLCHDQPSVPPTSLAITRPTAGAPPCASRRGAAAAAAQRTCAASTAQARHAGRTHGL